MTNIEYQPLFDKIEQALALGNLILAIDGGSAAGKTSLAELLRQKYDCAVFHADDFFLRPEQRTAQRLSEPGGNMDRERLKTEVLDSLKKGEVVSYSPFSCKSMSLMEPVTVLPNRLAVVEGAYSLHPEIADTYGLKVFLDLDPQLQRKRILAREDAKKAEMFFARWIPMEQRYFEQMKVKERCDIVIEIK